MSWERTEGNRKKVRNSKRYHSSRASADEEIELNAVKHVQSALKARASQGLVADDDTELSDVMVTEADVASLN